MKASEKKCGVTDSVRSVLWHRLHEIVKEEYGVREMKIFLPIPKEFREVYSLPENVTRFCADCYGDYIKIRVRVGRRYVDLHDYDWDAGEGYSVDEFLAVFVENQDKKDSEIQKMLKKRA